MNETQLMNLFINNTDFVRRVIITDKQLSILRTINNDTFPTMSAAELSFIKDITVQSASVQLRKLWNIGYLKREERVLPTGGIIYRYRINDALIISERAV